MWKNNRPLAFGLWQLDEKGEISFLLKLPRANSQELTAK